MTAKRPKLIYVLAIFFLWSFGRNLEALISYAQSANFIVFSGLGHPSWHFVQVAPLVILDGLAVWFLLKPHAVGHRIILADVVFSLATALWQTVAVLLNSELAKQAYVANREARGLPLHLDRLDTLVSPQTLFGGLAAAFVLDAVIAVYVLRHRTYLAGTDRSGTKSEVQHVA